MFTGLDNNAGVAYSAGISAQLLGRPFLAVPRFLWSLLATVLGMILALAGHASLSAIVQNFVSLLGYWAVPFATILWLEDVALRACEGYDLGVGWDDAAKLPSGIAAVGTLLVAYIAGVVGMAQTWFVGPAALAFGGGGGDVGVFLAAAWSGVLYLPFKYWERRDFG
ncbi:uncharacterized protein BDV14DRAFT_177190, partial [Aspergillus stella-maris]|uniref:uncharacterized protein n=1 Tax=Aspergillus stella-maris TaxID=1810926 RepID=UPI003CCDE36D